MEQTPRTYLLSKKKNCSGLFSAISPFKSTRFLIICGKKVSIERHLIVFPPNKYALMDYSFKYLKNMP